jgi:signal transduction histidine kinase
VTPTQPSEPRRRWRLGRFGRAVAPFLSAAIVLAFGLMAYSRARSSDDAAQQVGHTYQVIETNAQLLNRMVDAETGQRGYLITGDTAYLDPFRGASRDVTDRLAELRRLTADNPLQQRRLDTLEDLERRRFATLDARIRMRESTGFERSRAEFIGGQGGKPLMDSVRRVIAEIDTEERRLLAARRENQQAFESHVAWIVIGGAAAAALLALIVSLMMSHSAANEAFLAREVQHRADEVEAANAQLQDQAAEMEMLNEELQTTNEQLEARTAEAEEANRAKADFLANMSHDLRTPLNAIIGYVDLLETGVHGEVEDKQLHDIGRIKRSANHLRALITDVLEFAKIEAGQLQVTAEDVPMDAVVGEVRPLVEPQAASKGLTLKTSCASGLIARGDREKVDQILVNLLGNAIKYTDAGGRVEVECRRDGKWILTEVRDTGAGIPPNMREMIFSPFVQVESQGHRGNDRGVGLGLAISRELARAMGGDISVRSDLGQGSTFTLRLERASVSNK